MPKEEVLPVTGDIRAIYGRLSRFYGVVEGRFQKRLRERGLELLAIREGESVLEIGFGTGCALTEIARRVGESGRACGLDLTPAMITRARRRLAEQGPAGRA
ncbi:MAG: methyltransferase domain-containing protein, partial [Dehalococcoidia bacterium]|nr:methyltransferase domain-containing protein [Dehalococcoidia bacterium]